MTAAPTISTLFANLPASVTGAGSLTSVSPDQRPEVAAALAQRSFWTHLDVMDTAFAGRTGISIEQLPALLKQSHRSDIHLMVENPAAVIDRMIDLSPTRITVHLEAIDDPRQVSRTIRAGKISPWLAVGPSVPVAELLPVVTHFDGVLIMLLKPGSSGAASLSRAEAVSELCTGIEVGVDGGVDSTNLDLWIKSGARYIVAGRGLLEQKV